MHHSSRDPRLAVTGARSGRKGKALQLRFVASMPHLLCPDSFHDILLFYNTRPLTQVDRKRERSGAAGANLACRASAYQVLNGMMKQVQP